MKAQVAGAQVIQIFRLVGVSARLGRLSRVRPSAHTRTSSTPFAAPRADDPLRHRYGEHPPGSARGRRRRHRRRLAHSARRGMGSHRPRPRDPGQSRSDAAARAARPHAHGRRRRARTRGRTSGTHLQPRPRHSAFDTGRSRAGARATCAPHRLAMRDQSMQSSVDSRPAVDESVDVAVIGAGVSGLSVL